MSDHHENSNLVILIHPPGVITLTDRDGYSRDGRFYVVDADSYDLRARGFPTLEEAEAWASVYDKRWSQTPLTEVMREEEALRAKEFEAFCAAAGETASRDIADT